MLNKTCNILLGKKGRKKAASRKRRKDPDADRRGKAKNVKTK